MITLTREEAQQVLEHLDDLVEAQQWEIDMHITQYGEEHKPHRVKHMRERLASTNGTIETLRARLSAPESKPVAWLHSFTGYGWQVVPEKLYPTDQPLYTAPPQRKEDRVWCVCGDQIMPDDDEAMCGTCIAFGRNAPPQREGK